MKLFRFRGSGRLLWRSDPLTRRCQSPLKGKLEGNFQYIFCANASRQSKENFRFRFEGEAAAFLRRTLKRVQPLKSKARLRGGAAGCALMAFTFFGLGKACRDSSRWANCVEGARATFEGAAQASLEYEVKQCRSACQLTIGYDLSWLPRGTTTPSLRRKHFQQGPGRTAGHHGRPVGSAAAEPQENPSKRS